MRNLRPSQRYQESAAVWQRRASGIWNSLAVEIRFIARYRLRGGGPPSEAEAAALGCSREERQLYMGALHQPYMALYHHGHRINNEIQAMQAARGVAAPASTRGMGGMAARH